MLFCQLPAISSLPLPHFAINIQPPIKNITNILLFTVMDLSGNIRFLQQVEKVTSVGCNGLILIHVNVDFILW